MRNSIEKKRKTQWADIFLPFSHRSSRARGGWMNCRWMRRRRHILYDGNRHVAAFSDKSAKRGAAFVTQSLSLSPVRILSHCRRGQRQTGMKPSLTPSTPVMSDRGCVDIFHVFTHFPKKSPAQSLLHRRSTVSLLRTTSTADGGRNNITNLSAVVASTSRRRRRSRSTVAGFGNRSLF